MASVVVALWLSTHRWSDASIIPCNGGCEGLGCICTPNHAVASAELDAESVARALHVVLLWISFSVGPLFLFLSHTQKKGYEAAFGSSGAQDRWLGISYISTCFRQVVLASLDAPSNSMVFSMPATPSFVLFVVLFTQQAEGKA